MLRTVGKVLEQAKVRTSRIDPGFEIIYFSVDAKAHLNITPLLQPSRPDPFVKVIKRQDAIQRRAGIGNVSFDSCVIRASLFKKTVCRRNPEHLLLLPYRQNPVALISLAGNGLPPLSWHS